MKCVDCSHYEVCCIDYIGTIGTQTKDEECEYFMTKTRCIELPCRVGDTLYTNASMSGWYLRTKDMPYSAKVVFIGLNDSDKMGGGLLNVEYEKQGHMRQFYFNDFGNKIFLTKEEAEEALKERRGNEN